MGRDYQAVCPELQPEALRKPELLADRALLVWSPTTDIPESKRNSLSQYFALFLWGFVFSGRLHCVSQR